MNPSTPHPEVAPGVYAFLTRTTRALAGTAEYTPKALLNALLPLGIPLDVRADIAMLGENVALDLDTDADGRRYVPVVNLAAALYEYCFGEPITFPAGAYAAGHGTRVGVMCYFLGCFEHRLPKGSLPPSPTSNPPPHVRS